MGVLAGPSVVGCFNSTEGMGVCLRGEMTDAGILPQPADIAAPQQVPQEPVADVAVATPQLDVTPPEPEATPEPAPAIPDDLIAATFGLLRAEPDGSLVIAGSGRPGSEIEVYSNGEPIGTATVEPSGDWVLVPEQPLPPGGTELTLAEVGKAVEASQSFVVVINDDKSSEPLVVASTPGAASEVLQGLTPPAAGTSTEVAVAEPAVTPPAPAATSAPQVAAVVPAPQPTAPAIVPPVADTPAPAATPAVAEPTPAAPTPEAVPAAVGPAVAASSEPAPATPAPVEPATPAEPAPTALAAADPAPTPVEPTPQPETTIASTPAQMEPVVPQPDIAVAVANPVPPVATQPEITLENVPPSIDAVEIEGVRNFFAGGGPERAVMRLYVDGQYVADATVAGGRWLVESANVLTKPLQRIRIDMLKPGTADVAARAEVDFVVELPGEEAPVAVAAAQQPEVATLVPATEPTPAPQIAAVAEPVPAPATQPPVTAAAEPAPASVAAPAPVEAARVEPVAPAATAPAATAPAQPSVAVAEPASVQPPVTAAAEPAPLAPAPSEPAVAEPVAPSVAVADATPPTAEPTVPTLVAVQVGAPGDQRFASGKAIIRRGDNLWTIARRVYGQGIKYTTIYQANNGQIRNPNRIYPGQVFELPHADQ